VYHDKEYVRAGAEITTDLSEADIIIGVKEIPPEGLSQGKTYLMFSHVIKGQPHNMPMLARLLELGCTLIDYERVIDDTGQRLMFFGRFAGLAGMVDTLWALGRRLEWEGVRNPFARIEPTHCYSSLEDAKSAVRAAGRSLASDGLPPAITPMVIGIAGYGNVARGVREILAELPVRELTPDDVAGVNARDFVHSIAQVTFKELHLVTPKRSDQAFDLQDYYDRPRDYRPTFSRYLPHLTVLMNCNYWDDRYPRLVTNRDLRGLFGGDRPPRLRVIGDLGCDIGGGVQCTVKCTDPGDPVFVWDPVSGTASNGVEGPGPVVLAVDILPAELPREASEEFSRTLAPFLPALARADLAAPFDDLEIPTTLRRAVIAHRGELTPDYRYLRAHLGS
jgi:alpha-aminoadipic semialdehyde synthase